MRSPRPNRRAVEAAKNAPPDFGTKVAIAYGRDPSDRRRSRFEPNSRIDWHRPVRT